MATGKRSWITAALILGVMALGMGLFLQRFIGVPVASAEQLQSWGAYVYPEPKPLTAFQLQDHEGNPFDNVRLQEKWTLAFLGFTRCPDVCPTAMATLKQFQTLLQDSPLANSTQVVLISLDPAYDTPERMGDYVRQFDPSFVGVTGDLDVIQSLAHQLHVAFEQGESHGHDHADVMHSNQIALFDSAGRLAGFFRAPHNAGNLWLAYQAIRS